MLEDKIGKEKVLEKRTHKRMWLDICRVTQELKSRGLWHACRHEDGVTVGVPDMSYGYKGRCGWIEFKSIHRWPVRRVRVRDLTIHQVRWLEDRGTAGGSCWIMFSVDRDYVLVPWGMVRGIFRGGFPDEKTVRGQWIMWKNGLGLDFADRLIEKEVRKWV